MSNKPRPRPRPKPRAATGEEAHTSVPPGNVSPSKDVDDFFIRNRGFDVIKARAERDRKAEEESEIVDLGDPDPEGDSPNGKKRQRYTKAQRLPSWTTKINQGKSVFGKEQVNPDALDGSDDEITDLNQAIKRPRSKSPERSRPKSRSPTPPPPLAFHIRERARAIAREIIKDHIPHVNNIRDRESINALNQFKDNPFEIEDDDAEVAAMLRRIKSEYRPKDIRDTSSPAPGVGGLDRNVKIIITWVPHPAAKEHPPNTWDYIIDRDSDLRQIFKNIAGQKHIFAHDLVVTHEDHQIHGMKTPRQLEGLVREIHLSASEKNTYDIIRELRRQGKSQPEPFNLNDEENGDGDDDDDDDEPKAEEVRKIRLDLKSKPFPEAKRMNVKVTTACRSILAAYLKAVGVDPGKKGVRLMFEGESLALDKPIGSHDLDLDEDDEDDEDPSGVQIDVVGL